MDIVAFSNVDTFYKVYSTVYVSKRAYSNEQLFRTDNISE